MEISITWNICRVCLQEEQKNAGGEQMKQIFCENSKIAQHIYECSGIWVKPNDSLPQKICRKCFGVLKYAVKFRKTCKESDNYLQSVLQRTKSASILFIPERSTDLEDETMTDDPYSNDDGDEEESETQATKLEDAEEEFVNLKTVKCKNSKLLTKSKKPKSLDAANPAGMVITKEKETKSDYAVEYEHKTDNESNIHHDKVRLEEEIVENPEDVIDPLFSDNTSENTPSSKRIIAEGEQVEETDDHENSNKDLNKESAIREFYANDSYTKLSNEHLIKKLFVVDSDHDEIPDTEESDIHDLREENEDLYYILKGIKNKDPPTNTDRIPTYEFSHRNEEHIVEIDEQDEKDHMADVEFIPIDEEEEVDAQDISITMQLEDNQSQVTSTVVTKEDDSFIEENSNFSTETNDLTYEYVIDDYGIEEISIQSNKPISKAIERQGGRKRKSSRSTESQSYVCDLCGNNFNNRQLMNAHMKVHRQEKNHECEICFKRFITACNLQAHMRIHTGEKPFKCQYCGRRFNDRSSNLRHERTHTNEKPFHCEHCGKTFALSTTLQAHLKVHTGERSYSCETCAKSFKLPHQLKAHRKTTLHKAVEKMKNKIGIV